MHTQNKEDRRVYFEGSLGSLLDFCSKFGPSVAQIAAFDRWVASQAKVSGNILPVRKFKTFLRGNTIEREGLIFVGVDNEPLAALLSLVTEKKMQYGATLRDLITKKVIPLSWSIDSSPEFSYRTSGVSTGFRMHGLKIAHIENAGKFQDESSDSLLTRFFRTVAFSNVFLFPSPRVFSFEFEGLNVPINLRNPEEDDFIRALAKEWLVERMRSSGYEELIEFHSDLSPEIYRRKILNEMHVRVLYRNEECESSENPDQSIKERGVMAVRRQLGSFRVDADILKELNESRGGLEFEITAGHAHPTGIYIIPKETAINFINSKTTLACWQTYESWTSTKVPVALRRFFHPF